jgi:hypothetical protein
MEAIPRRAGDRDAIVRLVGEFVAEPHTSLVPAPAKVLCLMTMGRRVSIAERECEDIIVLKRLWVSYIPRP